MRRGGAVFRFGQDRIVLDRLHCFAGSVVPRAYRQVDAEQRGIGQR